jgi:hypothetical protein
MYALIICAEDGGEPELVATARTLSAIQRKWKKLENPDALESYRFIGILTESGLMNYYGDRIRPTSIGYVTLKMGLEYAGV